MLIFRIFVQNLLRINTNIYNLLEVLAIIFARKFEKTTRKYLQTLFSIQSLTVSQNNITDTPIK